MRKAEEFSKTKNAYLQKKKTGQQRSVTGGTKSDAMPSASAKKVYGGRHTAAVRAAKSSLNLESLPNEILFKIFTYLDMKSLLSCGATCRRLKFLNDDNSLWKPLYAKYVHFGPDPPSPLVVEDGYWKGKLFSDAKKFRNVRFLRHRDNRMYTGTENKLMVYLGTKFQLSLTLKDGSICTILERERGKFPTSILLQFYDLQQLPKLSDVKAFQIYAFTPILFGKDCKSIKNSPRQKCLVYSEQFDFKNVEKNKVFSDQHIDAFITKFGALLSLWSGTENLAFFSVSLHFHWLLEKCLLGRSDSVCLPRHEIKFDDVSKDYGLHGYKFHILIRAGYSNWIDTFESVAMSHNRYGDFIKFTQAQEKNSYQNIKTLSYKWKTDVFNGVIDNVAVLTLTVRDFNNDVIWYFSNLVKCEETKSETLDMASLSSDGLSLSCSDDIGKVELFFNADPPDRLSADSPVINNYYLANISFSINIGFINSWFGTNH